MQRYLRLFVLLASCELAQATILYDGFGPGFSFSNTGAVGVSHGCCGGGGPFDAIANQFVPTQTGTFTAFYAALYRYNNLSNPNTVTVFLMADAGGAPGTVLESITVVGQMVPGAASGVSYITAASLLQPLLTAGTPYWLGATTAVPDSVGWARNHIGGLQAYQVSGVWGGGPDAINTFRIDGTPLPEPGTWTLVAGGLLFLILGRRR